MIFPIFLMYFYDFQLKPVILAENIATFRGIQTNLVFIRTGRYTASGLYYNE